MATEFHPLTCSRGLAFQELLAIYHDAFPAEERQPDRVLQENIDSGISRAFIARDQNRVIFFIHVYHVPQTNLVFLDYAATHPLYRGKQIARQFFEQAFSLFGNDRILFCQQEAPNGYDNRIKCMRIAYFSRMGFQYLSGVPFMMPDHSGGAKAFPMVLCAMAATPLSTLPADPIAATVRFIFLQIYKRGENDELLKQNLGAIPDEIRLSEPLEPDPTGCCGPKKNPGKTDESLTG